MKDTLTSSFRHRCGIPTRYVMAIYIFFGFLIAHALRVNMSVAIVVMVKDSKQLKTWNKTINVMECSELMTNTWNQSILMNEKDNSEKFFDWDVETQSQILAAFYYGYFATQVPGSLLVQRFGAKWLCGLSLFICSILTLITPITAEWGTTYVILLRVVQGVVQSPILPAINVLIAHWIPIMERSRVFNFIFSGYTFGIMVGMFISGVLCESQLMGGWPSAFYVFGALGCLWFVLWAVLIYETPAFHPRISDNELKHIQENQNNLGKNILDVPWMKILKSAPVWAMTFTSFGECWIISILKAEIPTYLSHILHINIRMNGILSALPYIFQIIFGWIASYIADKLRQRGKFSISTIRKMMNSIALLPPGVCILILAFVGCRPIISITLLCIAVGLNGFVASGFYVTLIDMTPTYAAPLTGFTSTIGYIAGFMSTLVAGQITKSGHTLENWGWVFIVTAVIIFVTGIVFNLFASAEVQSWDPMATIPKSPNTNPAFVSDEDIQRTTNSRTESTKL